MTCACIDSVLTFIAHPLATALNALVRGRYLDCLPIRLSMPSCFIPAIDRRTTPALVAKHERARAPELGECVHALVDAMELNGASLLY